MSRIRADQLVNRVGSGGPKFPNGVAEGFSVSGIVTATSYRGDGSQLTGIDASSLKDGSNVKVQAVSSGANVTGNVAATGNVTAVNVTASGNVSAVNATFSGDLTVNGTTTTIDTAVTAVDSLAVDGNITALGSVGIGTNVPENGLHVSDGSSFAAPQNAGAGRIMIEHGSSADLQFMTANSGYSHIFFGDQDDANAGVIYYQHNSGVNAMVFSTNATERLRITSAGHLEPTADNTYDLGGSGNRWRNIYTGDLNLSNEGSANDVDGTWGQYTIQEGENDLFLINKRTGKKYKFNLTEVD